MWPRVCSSEKDVLIYILGKKGSLGRKKKKQDADSSYSKGKKYHLRRKRDLSKREKMRSSSAVLAQRRGSFSLPE